MLSRRALLMPLALAVFACAKPIDESNRRLIQHETVTYRRGSAENVIGSIRTLSRQEGLAFYLGARGIGVDTFSASAVGPNATYGALHVEGASPGLEIIFLAEKPPSGAEQAIFRDFARRVSAAAR